MKTVESRTLCFPWPPSNNRYYRRVGSRVLICRAGREYRQQVAYELFAQAGRVEPMTGRLSVVLSLYPPDRIRRDIDNLAKALLDALAHAGVYEDDSQIDRLLLERCEIRKPGVVEVNVRELC